MRADVRSLLVSPDALERRRADLAASSDLKALDARLRAEVGEFVARPLYVPEAKALLSRWGSLCRDDGAELAFDPWSPDAQRCTRCGRIWTTEQSHRWWVYWYQLWLAERCWEAALLAVLDREPRCEARALETLATLAARYLTYPNADNVLGPSRPFFSTYLESVWVVQLAAAASLLAEHGRLPAGLERDLAERLFRPSAALIADFDEGLSNRQVWNAAALYALGRVLGDAELARQAAHGGAGILALLERGVLADGLWYEGENYHWFALRGLAWGAEMLRTSGDVDLWTGDDARAARFREAFWAPVLTSLPDFTFPARRDSKFGVSLRQRRMAELWELALARHPRPGLPSLLAFVYDESLPVAPGGAGGAITEVERHEPASGTRRRELGWKGLLWMPPDLPAEGADLWRPGTVHLEATGLAIFRDDALRRYVSLDYGESGGGHGHPDRLNFTLHSGGAPWLVDFGTGSYVSRSLAWYRTTLAHNAPLVDGLSQTEARGVCVGFEERDGFGWACAQTPDGTAYDGAGMQRTVVVTPWYVLDVVQMASSVGERALAVPWHGLGRATVHPAGVTFERAEGVLPLFLAGRQPFQVQLTRAPGPPPPDGGEPADLEFAVVASSGEQVTLVTCVGGETVEEVECHEEEYVVRLADGGMHTHVPTETGWRIDLGRGDPIDLGGARELPEEAPRPAPAPPEPRVPAARSLAVSEPPALDGSLDGFRLEAPLALDRPEQFRRAEEAWEGAAVFSARAWLNHSGSMLYLAVEVTAPAPAFRPRGAPNPEWDNENPDIHSDGIQVYVDAVSFFGWLIVPDADEPARLKVAAVAGTDAEPEMVQGAWQPTDNGYRITCAFELPDDLGDFGFDLHVNRIREGRERRTAQLVWSGARGSRLYLAGDRPLTHSLPLVAAREGR